MATHRSASGHEAGAGTLTHGRQPSALAWAIATACLLLASALTLLEPHDPTQARLLGDARLARLWRTYYAGDFEAARAQADACARAWEPEATRVQAALGRSPAGTAALGHVDALARQHVLARTALNGAAICFHVAGRAAEALHQPEAARAAYAAAMRFPDGRCLDAREDVLWSPAAASDALRHRLR